MNAYDSHDRSGTRETPACEELFDSRPRMREDLELTVHTDRNGGAWFRLLTPTSHSEDRPRFLRLGLAEYALLAHLDGSRSIEQARVAAALRDDSHRLSASQAESLVMWAQQAGLFSGPGNPLGSPSTDAFSSTSRPSLLDHQSLARMRFPLLRGGPWLQPLVRLFGWIFTPVAAVGVAFVWLLAVLAVIADQDRFIDDLQAVWTPGGWLRLALVWCLLKGLHEAAHAISCSKFGGRVGELGFVWMIVAPVAYVDLTDAYRIASRGRRIATSLAGIYVELTVAAVALLLWTQTEAGVAAYTLSTIAVTAGVGSLLFNLNPLMKLDGYYALTDWRGCPNLATRAQSTLLSAAAWLFFGRRLPGSPDGASRTWLLFYGSAAWLYRLTVISALLLAAVRLYGRIGLVVAVVTVATMGLRPVVNALRHALRTFQDRPVTMLRSMVVASLLGALVWAITASPLTIQRRYAAVVEYVDDVPLRTQAAGFVAAVQVRDGQTVRAGEILLVLENQSLLADLVSAQAEWQAALSRSRRHRQSRETALAMDQQQAAAVLQQRVEQLQTQVEQLTIRAPRSGLLIAPETENLVGQWLHEGAAIGWVVDQTCMKAIVAVPQTDLSALKQRLSQPLVVLVGEQRIAATLLTVAEQTSSVPPHPALPATAGGELAVRHDAKSAAEELLEPHLKIELLLSQRPAGRRAGEPAWLLY